MRKPVLLGTAAIMLTAAAGYTLVISPQSADTTAVNSQLVAVHASNAAAAVQIPALKARLADISGTVTALRNLSGQVPPVIDLPSLYQQLDAVAAQAGDGVKVTNVTLTIPALVTTTANVPAVAPTDTATATTPDASTAPTPAPTPAAAAVLASYQVTMEVQATPAEAAKFLTALGQMPRMSVVTATSLTSGSSSSAGTAHILATLYLQQVDVDALAAQIEALAAARSTSAPAVSTVTVAPSETATSTPAATAH